MSILSRPNKNALRGKASRCLFPEGAPVTTKKSPLEAATILAAIGSAALAGSGYALFRAKKRQ
jgi:hypothetical protein